MAQKIQLRGDTKANWTLANPVLAHREKVLELDTMREKVGDGVKAYNDLAYFVDKVKERESAAINERLKYQNIEPENREITRLKELYDIRVATNTQTTSVWSKFGFWSWAVAKKDMIVDEIGVHVVSLEALTGDLRVKVFVDGALAADLTKVNASLGATTLSGHIETIDIASRIAIKIGQTIAVGWEMSNSQKIQLVHCTIDVNNSYEFGLNKMLADSADGSIISAAIPPSIPESAPWYLPFYFNSYKVTDKTVEAKFNAKVETVDAKVVSQENRILEIQKNGNFEFKITPKINPTATLWNYNDVFINKWWSIHYVGIAKKYINRISVPIARDMVNNRVFGGDILVKVFLNNSLVVNKTILNSELQRFNLLTSSSAYSEFLYDIDVASFLFDVSDVLFVGVECLGENDKIAMFYNMAGQATDEWQSCYTLEGNNSGGISNLTAPTNPVTSAFYRVIKFSFVDYIAKQIEVAIDSALGQGGKLTLNVMPPKKIYTVFNDQMEGGDYHPTTRNHSIPIYIDGLLTGITEELDVNFKATGNERFPVFADELTQNVVSEQVTLECGQSSKYNDFSFSFVKISTKESVGKSKIPRVMVNGDSVSDGYLASNGIDTSVMPAQYWSVIKEQFEKAKIDAGDNAAYHNAVMVGHRSVNSFSLNYRGVTNRNVRAFAEGYGGWDSVVHMYYSRNWADNNCQGMYDLLGLGNGTGTDYTGTSAQILAINTTPEGKYVPKNTAAFIAFINSQLGLTVTTYADAVTALSAKEADPENPFYSKSKAQSSDVAYSLSTYLSRYKTLSNDGTTRLVVGTTAGTKVADVNAYDVCLPSHIIIQHSHNDGDAVWFAANMRKWTNAIKAEYVANGWGTVFIGISVIRFTGTFYPSRYPMFDRASIALWQWEGWGLSNYKKIIDEFWVSDTNEDTEKIYILPSIPTTATAWATPYRKAVGPEYDINGLEQYNTKIIDGSGPQWHPGAIAHRCWGMEMYAWIKYTMSLM